MYISRVAAGIEGGMHQHLATAAVLRIVLQSTFGSRGIGALWYLPEKSGLLLWVSCSGLFERNKS